MKKIILLLLIIIIAGAGIYVYMQNQPTKVAHPKPMPEYGTITVDEAAPLFMNSLPKDYVVVDVRTKKEYENNHTEGTINIPVAIFETADHPCAQVESMLPKGKKIIFVCPFGPRSRDMYQNLTDPKADLGCGMDKKGLYHLWARVRFKKDHLVVQRRK